MELGKRKEWLSFLGRQKRMRRQMGGSLTTMEARHRMNVGSKWTLVSESFGEAEQFRRQEEKCFVNNGEIR